MDSPGGEVGGLFDLVDEIYNARAEKPCMAIADSQGIPPAQSYRLQVVRTSGRVEHELPAVPEGDHVSAKLERGLAAGRYWIRLCNENGDILREFDLKVQ